MSTVPSIELPVEIWRKILEPTLPDQGAAISLVNQMFFEIAIARRYKSVSWGFMRRDNARGLHALKSPLVSRYIQELCIHITPSNLFAPPPKPTLRGRIFAKNTTPILPEVAKNEAQEFLEGFTDPVDLSGRFPSLRLLAISATSGPWELRHYHPFQMIFKAPIRQATQSVAATVRILVLTIPLELYRDGVSACDLNFPLLEDLHMEFHVAYLTTDYEGIFTTSVVPFVNRHSQSLTKLSFGTTQPRDDCPQRVYTFEALMGGLSHIQGLLSFTFYWFILPTMEPSLHKLSQFIHAHSATLSKLTLSLFHSFPVGPRSHFVRNMKLSFREISRFYTPSTLFSHRPFTEALQSCRMLKKLDCTLLGQDSFRLNDATPFLLWFPTLKSAQTLTTLHLRYNRFNQADIIKLVSSADLSSLRDLSIRCWSLNVTLFDIFADRLGSLQELRVSISGISTRASPSEVSVPQEQLGPDSPFLLDLQGSSYPGWMSLTALYLPLEDEEALKARRYMACCWGSWEEECWLSESQFPETFPKLQTFGAKIN
ncbi:hypothetical protein FA13DRAFT_489672 [Coprinellus micaceus]|uniref:F-box domain-containing protein n=1 Tax=Coprinellus micaceus TaxID=71717 RepID=A0A4Y7SBY4_COPMI|nr:hypothetical protein FA13DRAFT_489672 [Coprinellus micaceus]